MAFLMDLNATFPSSVHSNLASFFNSFCRGFINSAKFGMNLLMKLIWPLKDWRAFRLWGKGTFLIASSLSGSTLTPYLEMMCPNNLPSSTPNIDLAGFKEIPYFWHLIKTCLRWLMWSDISFEKTVKSSWYISIIFPISYLKEKYMALWKVAPTFNKPKGILKNL